MIVQLTRRQRSKGTYFTQMTAPTIVAACKVAPQECISEWDQSSTTALIHMYRERKCLWDSSHEFYKNRQFRREALAEMASRFNCCLADVEKKLYMLRSSFRKEYRRWNSAKLNAGPNGAYLVRKPQWFALDLLMFLKDDIASKSSTPTNLSRGNDDNSPQQLDDSSPLQKDILNIFYYDSENNTLTPLDVNEVSLERNSQQLQSQDNKRTASDSSKRYLGERFPESSSKRQKANGVANDSGVSRTIKIPTSKLVTEKDSSVAFGNFVAEELKNIKDHEQMQLARLRIHQILFDGARGLLKMPILRL